MSGRGRVTGTVTVMAFPTVATVTRTILEGIDSATQKKAARRRLYKFLRQGRHGASQGF